jgi:adenylate cyclase
VRQFRSFRLRLLTAILGLTALAQLAAFIVVRDLHGRAAGAEITAQLGVAAEQFTHLVALRTTDLSHAAAALSHDRALSETLSTATNPATLKSALESFQSRVDAGVVVLFSRNGRVLAATSDETAVEPALGPLQKVADSSEDGQATGYTVLNRSLYSVAVVPLYAPDIVAWIAIGFRLDAAFVRDLKASTGVEISLSRGDLHFASTVSAPADFVTVQRTLPTSAGQPAEVVLQYSRDEKLKPARDLERVLGFVFAGSLVVATLIALVIARGVSEPVLQLAAHTKRVAAGDYEARVHLERNDELGQLASAFNAMTAGLAERDRIRDLLDKNVSPEIATQLLRDGAALGGEEREVTVLFADLRGFTTLSEQLQPPELLALLNRYLDRMSGEIERHGGVIDKFIGDAIMALFGAPVDQSDSADRALAAALGMEQALSGLNVELAAEGRRPLALGIGINTARVVAGNIGSHRRLNYSVIGDGVNVAARLESLTRTPDYHTSIITSAATAAAIVNRAPFSFRPLGSVQVKGRAASIEIFAVEAAPGHSPQSRQPLRP